MIRLKHLAGVAALTVMGGAAQAQFGPGWYYECIDPENDSPYSDDYGINLVGNDLIMVAIGGSGDVTYGGQDGPCFSPSRTFDAEGRFAFNIGPVGSIQTTFDDLLALTFGAPVDPVGDFCFARILKNGNTEAEATLFGDGGFSYFWSSDFEPRITAIWDEGDINVALDAFVIGDAVRLEWKMTNLTADSLTAGLIFATQPAMRTGSPFITDSQRQSNQAHTYIGALTTQVVPSSDGFNGLVTVPGVKPFRHYRKWDEEDALFPPHFDVTFGQTDYVGMRFLTGSAPGVEDAARSDLILFAEHFFTIRDNRTALTLPFDPTGQADEVEISMDETAIVQRFPVSGVVPGGTRELVQYIRAPWSVGDYAQPYALVLDAPQVVAALPSAQNGLTPNPMRIRAWIDNWYNDASKEVTLPTVRATITLPAGLSLVDGESASKEIYNVTPNNLQFIDWVVESDGTTFGDLGVNVRTSAISSDTNEPYLTKDVTTTITIASTPRMRLGKGASMVGFPYDFQTTSLDAITGLSLGADYTAFEWDAINLDYKPVASPKRGVGYWFVPNADLGILDLNGASQASDANTGGMLTTVKRGWNLIANPYNYPLPLSHLVAVVEGASQEAQAWSELVTSGYVAPALVDWDRDHDVANSGAYKYQTGQNIILEPHKGYWVFVLNYQPIHISWPVLYQANLPGSGRGAQDPWTQTSKQWRLQLAARTTTGLDSGAYVGVAADRKQAEALNMPKAPRGMGQTVEIAVMDQYAGELNRMAQSFSDRQSRNEWKVMVASDEAGDVTVTWPNLVSVPKNIRLKVVDEAAGISKDMRASSGYTFRLAEPGSRELTVKMEVGGSVRPMIGNVVVSRPGRDKNAPVTVNYALSADATVSVRILSATGREIYTVTRGRADNAGENSITWLLRDSANRAVAPGVYRVEILAESSNGERVRKIVPVNVIR